MVRNASRTHKIGVHSRFGPNFHVGISTFYPEKFRLAYVYSSSADHFNSFFFETKGYLTIFFME